MHATLSNEQFQSLLDEMARRFAPALEEKTRAVLKDLGLTKPLRARPGLASAGKDAGRHEFLRAVLRGESLHAKALSTATASGGHLTPEGFREEIVSALPRAASLAPHVRVVPVATDTGHVPSLAVSGEVAWGGAENTSFNAVDPTVGQVAWKLKRADLLTKLSRELVADAAPSLVSFVVTLFQDALARGRDKMIAVGNGGTEPEGLATADLPTVEGVAGEPGFEKLVAIERALPRPYRQNARWIVSAGTLRKLYQLADEAGHPLFLRDVVDGNPESRLLGYPVAEADDLADDLVIFGDLRGYLWFDREEMGVESTTTGGDAFEHHQVWIKLWERADGKVAIPEAFVKADFAGAGESGG